MDCVKIKARSILGWPTWVVKVGDPIEVDGSMERPVRFINDERRGTVFSRADAEALMPFVLKVRQDAEIVPVTYVDEGE